MFSTKVDSHWFPTCAVFDCDGVLLDSETVWGDIQQEIFDHYRVTPTVEIRERLVGSAATDLAEAIVELTDHSQQSTAEIAEFHAEVFAKVHYSEANIIDRGVDIIPGALELIQKLSAVMPVAVASNSSSDLLTRKLEKFGHRQYLTAWVGANDVENPKPAADMYQEAIRRLGGTPSRTFTIEDSFAGARAAQAAGTTTYIYTQTPEHAPPAQGYFDSFTDPDFLAQVDTWIERAKTTQE